jgi:hypothetical protein
LHNTTNYDLLVDEIIDYLPTSPANVTYISDSSKYDNASIGNPTITGNILTWGNSSNFLVPANSDKVLEFQATVPSDIGYYTNLAIAHIGNIQIDKTLDINDDEKADATFYVGQLYSICGYKWSDLNNNGVWDSGELGLSGWTIQLKTSTTGDPIASTTTGDDGSYCFTGLLPGTYYVYEVNQTGWNQTYPTSPNYHTVTITNSNVTNINFGNYQITYSICGYKWSDLNNNGVWDSGELGLSGWTIQLRDSPGGTIIATTTT